MVLDGRVYEFSRISGTGHAIIHPPGDPDTQSSLAVSASELVRAFQFHQAWGEANDRDDYNKEDWKRAQRAHESEAHPLDAWLRIVKSAPGPIQPWERTK